MTKRKYKLHYSEALGEVLRRPHHNNTSCRDTSFLKGITLHVSKYENTFYGYIRALIKTTVKKDRIKNDFRAINTYKDRYSEDASFHFIILLLVCILLVPNIICKI